MEINEKLKKMNGFSDWDDKKKIDYITYFLTSDNISLSVTAVQIEQVFYDLNMKKYSRTSAYLSEESGSKNGKYIKKEKGYRLERKIFDEIKRSIDNEPKMVVISKQLSDLMNKMKDTQEKSFLSEAINCYKVEAYRASIVMVWALTIDHLQKYIFGNKLNEFNTAILNDSNKKLKQIIQYDDFSDIKENKLIELMRSAGIISNDIRKILDEKLGIRNTAGHPSNIVVLGTKATEFIDDLVNNIILKF